MLTKKYFRFFVDTVVAVDWSFFIKRECLLKDNCIDFKNSSDLWKTKYIDKC